MDFFEITMLTLCLAVVAYHVWRDGKPRKKLTGRRWVIDRIELVVVAMLLIVLLPVAALLGIDAWNRFERSRYTPRAFDQAAWLAGEGYPDENPFVRWEMHEDAASHIRLGMTKAEVEGLLGEGYESSYSDAVDEQEQDVLEYFVGKPGVHLFGAPSAYIEVRFKDGLVTSCRTGVTSS